MTSSPGGVPCSDTPDTVYFFYGLPYGARQVVDPTGAIFYFPIGQNDNNGYNCAPINPYFVGWQNQYDVINAMLSAASIASLTVFEVDFVPELDVTDFPAMGRFVVDNAQANSDPNAIGSFAVVRDRLRDKMTGNGFDPGGVTWSAAWANSTLGGYDCTAVYGVSARAITLGGVSSAIGGGYIGTPDNTSFNNQLLCGGVVGTMQLMPYGSYQPNIVDIHLYDAVSVDASILVMHPEYAMVQSEATLDFTDISNYLTIVQLQSSVVVLGETHSNTYDNDPMYLGLTCEHVAPYTAASQIVAGFNDANNALKGHSIVFRPWIELQWPSGFCFTPNNQHVNLNGQGPYTPSQFTP